VFGGSSAGKTTVAEALVRQLPGLWLIAGVDIFWGLVPAHLHGEGAWLRRESGKMDRITRGWHRAVAAIAREGNNVVVDELLLSKRWFDDWEQTLQGLK
jgi:chloramphenicol 3-O phosphotransferase